MRRFVKLSTSAGLALALPVEEISSIEEPGREEASKLARSGCTVVTTSERTGGAIYYVCGDVDAVLRLIAAAQLPEPEFCGTKHTTEACDVCDRAAH